MPSTFKQPLSLSGPSWDVAYPVGPPIFSAPIAGVAAPYVVRQEFQILKRSFAYLALDESITYPDSNTYAAEWEEWFTAMGVSSSDYTIVEESETTDIEGGCVRWTRTYAAIPAQHVQPTNITYNFIGYYPGQATIINGVLTDGRARFQDTVPAEMIYDYAYLENPADVATVLPQIPAQAYGYKNALTGVPYPAYLVTDQIWGHNVIANVDSNPTLAEYQAWIAQTAFNPATGNYTIVAEPSSIERWMGNIYCRKQIQIAPQ